MLQTLNGSDNVAWAVLAIGAYRARVLGWVPALGVAFMMTHYSGVLKGTDLNSLGGCGAGGGGARPPGGEPVAQRRARVAEGVVGAVSRRSHS